MEDRAGKKGRRLGPQDLAESIWHALPDSEKGPPVPEWIKTTWTDNETVHVPEGKPEALGAGDFFNPTAVTFKSSKENHQINYSSPEQAALVADLARLGVRGETAVPKSAATCSECLKQMHDRMSTAQEKFAEVAAQRTGTESLQEKTTALLLHWYVLGKT